MDCLILENWQLLVVNLRMILIFLWGLLTQFMNICISEKLVHSGYWDIFLPSIGREDCKSAMNLRFVLTRRARIFLIALSPVTKPGYIISLQNPNDHQRNGRTHHHPKNCEQFWMQAKWWQVISGTNMALFSCSANINSECYCEVLTNVLNAVEKKQPGLITKGVLFQQDNTRPHTAHRTICTLQQLGWELLPYPPCTSILVPSDFHLFGPLKDFSGG